MREDIDGYIGDDEGCAIIGMEDCCCIVCIDTFTHAESLLF